MDNNSLMYVFTCNDILQNEVIAFTDASAFIKDLSKKSVLLMTKHTVTKDWTDCKITNENETVVDGNPKIEFIATSKKNNIKAKFVILVTDDSYFSISSQSKIKEFEEETANAFVNSFKLVKVQSAYDKADESYEKLQKAREEL